MSTLNQSTPYNPTENKIVNTINLEHSQPLVEHTLGKHPILSSAKSEAISDPGSVQTTELFHKPIVFRNDLEWAVSQEINTVIYTASLLSIFETLNRSPGGQALRGNAFFRSGAKIELKLTSSPFHCGKLVFYYVPPGVSTQFRESIYAKVQFPCVYVDAGNSTTGILDIPFVAIKDFFSTYNPDKFSNYGDIGIAILNPLRIGTGGPTSVQMALTLHPTQNQISLPVLAHDIDLQGMEEFQAHLAQKGNDELSGSILDLLNNFDTPASFLTEEAKNILFSLLDSHNNRNNPVPPPPPNPSTSQGVTPNPVISNPPKNPNNTTTQTKVNESAPSLSNPAGVFTEHLSLVPERTVHMAPPTNEMDLIRVAQTPSLLQIREWSDASASGTTLFVAPIDPMVSPFTQYANQTSGIYYPTYLSHVIEPFAYWRGSIDYHFSFASTDQHKGKVIVAWVPFDEFDANGASKILPTPTVEDLSLFPNEVFDLSLNKEFTFSVPYNSETPYRQIFDYDHRMPTDGSNFNSQTDSTQSLGTLVMLVYNKLSHPSTVASTINFNVYIKAGSDFEFKALRFSNDAGDRYQKINYITLQGLDMIYETTREGMKNGPVNRVGVNTSTLSNATFQPDMSERHLGLLLQKYYPQFAYQLELEGNDTRDVRIGSIPGLSFRSPRNTTEPAIKSDPRWRNLIAHYRDIYAFWKGSLNYFLIHNTTVNTPILLMVSHDPTDYVLYLNEVEVGDENLRPNMYYIPIENLRTLKSEGVDLSETSIYSHISNLRVNPTIEITTPHRSIFRRLYNIDNRTSMVDGLNETQSTGVLDLKYSNPVDDTVSLSAIVFQSIGDDFQFKYLIPPPSLKSTR